MLNFIELPIVEPQMEIGKLNIKTQKIEINQKAPIKYSCSLSGNCCTHFFIPVTDFDIERIEDHGYELDQIIEQANPIIKLPKTEFGSIEKNYSMKRKPFTNECTFLENGICTIHEFKPFGCRIFPFQIEVISKDEVKVIIHESNFCPSVKIVNKYESQNEKFLRYLMEEIISELKIREKYFEFNKN